MGGIRNFRIATLLRDGEWRGSFYRHPAQSPETLRNSFPSGMKEGRTLIFLGLLRKQEVDVGEWKEPF